VADDRAAAEKADPGDDLRGEQECYPLGRDGGGVG
jgi:hypothetical protein